LRIEDEEEDGYEVYKIEESGEEYEDARDEQQYYSSHMKLYQQLYIIDCVVDRKRIKRIEEI